MRPALPGFALILSALALAGCSGPIGGVGAFGGAPAGQPAPAAAPVFTPEAIAPQDTISTTSLG